MVQRIPHALILIHELLDVMVEVILESLMLASAILSKLLLPFTELCIAHIRLEILQTTKNSKTFYWEL